MRFYRSRNGGVDVICVIVLNMIKRLFATLCLHVQRNI